MFSLMPSSRAESKGPCKMQRRQNAWRQWRISPSAADLMDELIGRAEELGQVSLTAPPLALRPGRRRAGHYRGDLHLLLLLRNRLRSRGSSTRRPGLVEHAPGLRGLVERGGRRRQAAVAPHGEREAEERTVHEDLGALRNRGANVRFAGAGKKSRDKGVRRSVTPSKPNPGPSQRNTEEPKAKFLLQLDSTQEGSGGKAHRQPHISRRMRCLALHAAKFHPKGAAFKRSFVLRCGFAFGAVSVVIFRRTVLRSTRSDSIRLTHGRS